MTAPKIQSSKSPEARNATAKLVDGLRVMLVEHFRRVNPKGEIPDRWAGPSWLEEWGEKPLEPLDPLDALRAAVQDVQRDGFDEVLGMDYLRHGISDLIAARKEEAVKLLIDAFDATHVHLDGMGDSVPLLEAVRADLPGLCQWLIERGADVDFCSASQFNPLAAALVFADIKVVKMLLDAGADLRDGSPRGSALYYCIRNGRPEMMDLLVEHGANLKARLLDGFTPLSFAAKDASYAWAIDKLVELGVDPNELDGFDMRPVDWAVTANTQSSDAVQDHPLVRLARAGADFDLMREACANSVEHNVSEEVLRELRSILMEKKLHSAMSGVPNAEDFVHNGPENGKPHPKTGGFSPL